MGWDVVRMNYLGDWAKQFGLLTVEGQRFGSEAELATKALKHLLEVYARLNALFAPEEATSSILRKVGVTVDHLQQHIAQNPSALEVDADNDHYINLLRLVARYPDVTAMALRNHEPSTTLTYLFRLTHHVSASYDVIRVVGSDISRDVTLTRAALYASARQVLADGMRLLRVVPVDRYVMN